MTSLVLTVTRACNHRCSYCPTAKDGWPALDAAQAERAVELFASHYGGGDVKIFGGEPLLEPRTVRAALEAAAALPAIRRVELTTNGAALDRDWLRTFRRHPKAGLRISLDGRPSDHRALRRPLPGVADAYDRVIELLPELTRTPRLQVVQTIAPGRADAAADNFEHLLSLGFRRFSLLPVYYVAWRDAQLSALETSLDRIASRVLTRWAAGQALTIRNLFVRAATPLFNAGVVVDCDGTIHASNAGVASALEPLLEATRAGTLDAPPAPEELEAIASRVSELLEATLDDQVWRSTLAVDAALTRFCQRLLPMLLKSRRGREARAASPP